jgi:hypothetical protein
MVARPAEPGKTAPAGARVANCPKCGKPGLVMPLHLDKGGPEMCLQCGMEWHAKHTRRRRFGRIVIKAMRLYLDNGGKFTDLDKFKQSIALASLGMGDPFFLDANTIGTDVGDITTELLAEVLQLTHPDKHPPERRELATRVTQELLALQPFVFPAPKPKPVRPVTPPRDGSLKSRRETPKEPSRPAYPCKLCADTVPYYYCTACKAEWERCRNAEDEQRRAKQRAQYARRQARKRSCRPTKLCAAGCGSEVEANRKDARFCSPRCRQRAHRRRCARPPRASWQPVDRVTAGNRVAAAPSKSRDGVEARP